MKHLYVFCEGSTEQAFCKRVLEPHFFPSGMGTIQTRAVGQSGDRHVYGLGRGNNYYQLKKFIGKTINSARNQDAFFTTLIDLYALPVDFPSKAEHPINKADPIPAVNKLEAAFAADINCHRFIPHLQLYEFETMLFADPVKFELRFENYRKAIAKLIEMASIFPSIEHINEGAETAPSKRIIKLIPEYAGRKAIDGPEIASAIGLPTIRQKCPHFNAWITTLEKKLWANDQVHV